MSAMLVQTLFCACLLSSVTHGAKILAVFMTPSYSHQIVFQPVWKELSLRGHQVTVFTPNPLNDKSLINLTEHDMGFSREPLKALDKAGQDIDKLTKIFGEVMDLQLSHPSMRNLIKNANNETYDLLLVEYFWPVMYAFKEIYKVPMVGITSFPLTIGGSDALGMDKHPVLEPDVLMQFSYAQTFKERVLSWAFKWLYRLTYKLKIMPRVDAQIRRHFGDDLKSAAELTKEVSIVIGNYNFALQNIKPMVPNYIPISAIHVQPPKPLPPNLANFLDNLKNDVIYFSLGNNIRSSQVPRTSINSILNILGRLPYTVLWKYESDDIPSGLPKNFFVRKWFPQQDILAHPKVKLFITQGGIQSIDEAISREVPMMVIPFHTDQNSNADRCVRMGIAETINIQSFSDEEFEEKLNGMLNNSTYQENILIQSQIVKDQPLGSLDTAVFWIEYVIRHKGAPHLKYAAVNLPFYQYYLLDVYLFVGLMFCLVYYVGKRATVVVLLTYKFLKKRLISLSFLRSEKTVKKE